MASSLVGTSTSARGPVASASGPRRARIGSANAAVLPVPVAAWPTRSRPSTKDGIASRNVFSRTPHRRVMQKRLPKAVFKSVVATIEHGEPLDPTVADIVASAMKDWAIEKGATHYAHVFYPLTGLTAEKHDSFLEPDGTGGVDRRVRRQDAVQGEPDASSFPNGGLRQTFEARGYTAWDVTSPAYILENPNGNTLCIPTVFVSWTGEALDKKTPLLRSQQALKPRRSGAAPVRPRRGPSDPVSSFAGAEQEYFLIDRNFFFARPDLMATGRTLFGARRPRARSSTTTTSAPSPSGCWRSCSRPSASCSSSASRPRPATTRSRPGQFEIAPVFEKANIATDHQQLLMVTLRGSPRSTAWSACCTRSRSPA
jgi:glutamine synthetase